MCRLGKRYTLILAHAVMIACGLLLGAGAARAGWHDYPNTARIENVTVAPRDEKTATVSFDISWRGSWRHEGNHDAVWVFFKVQAEGRTDWQPVRLVADKVLNPEGYGQAPGGTLLDLIVPDDDDGFVGMFVRRAEFGQGKVAASRVTAVWGFTANQGVTKDAKVRVQAFGIEMVYVPEGAFNLGSGGVEVNSFFMYTDGVNSDTPYRVTGPGAIPTGRQKGKLWSGKGAAPEDGGAIPATFPNGYAAFYCMKSYIKGGQYAGFLNTLAAEEADKHYPGTGNITRLGTAPNYTYKSDAEDHVYDGYSWADAAAFAAWAGLRPMTELEYEKASRGPIEPGWETGFDLQYNSYWGMHDFNGWKTSCEHPATVANAVGRRFKGTHGRGTTALPADWPREDAVGMGTRGGWEYRNPSCRTAAASMPAERVRFQTWRGVRTAPKGVGL